MNMWSTIDIYGITKHTITLNTADVTYQIIGYVHRSSANKVLIDTPSVFDDTEINLESRDNARDNAREASETFLVHS